MCFGMGDNICADADAGIKDAQTFVLMHTKAWLAHGLGSCMQLHTRSLPLAHIASLASSCPHPTAHCKRSVCCMQGHAIAKAERAWAEKQRAEAMALAGAGPVPRCSVPCLIPWHTALLAC